MVVGTRLTEPSPPTCKVYISTRNLEWGEMLELKSRHSDTKCGIVNWCIKQFILKKTNCISRLISYVENSKGMAG